MTMQIDLSKIPNMEEREEAARLYEVYVAALDAADEARDDKTISDDAVAKLDEACDAARGACQAYPAKVDTNYQGGVIRCALSDVPIIDTDELLEDTHTDEYVLRCLVLPPRSSDEGQEEFLSAMEAAE